MHLLKQKKQQLVSARIAYWLLYIVAVCIGIVVSIYVNYFSLVLFFISIFISYLSTSVILKINNTKLIELLSMVIKELEDIKGTYKDKELQLINEDINSYNRMLSKMKKDEQK